MTNRNSMIESLEMEVYDGSSSDDEEDDNDNNEGVILLAASSAAAHKTNTKTSYGNNTNNNNNNTNHKMNRIAGGGGNHNFNYNGNNKKGTKSLSKTTALLSSILFSSRIRIIATTIVFISIVWYGMIMYYEENESDGIVTLIDNDNINKNKNKNDDILNNTVMIDNANNLEIPITSSPITSLPITSSPITSSPMTSSPTTTTKENVEKELIITITITKTPTITPTITKVIPATTLSPTITIKTNNDDAIKKNDEKNYNEIININISNTSSNIANVDNNNNNNDNDTNRTNILNKSFLYSELSKMTINIELQQRMINQTKVEEYKNEYGYWHFYDSEELNRPYHNDYCGLYINRDIPGNEFPDNSWQNDPVYVNHILDSASEYIRRTKESIYIEYGYGKNTIPPGHPELLKHRANDMFHFDILTNNNMEDNIPPEPYRKGKGSSSTRGTGGYMSQRSYDGFVKRILHAIMTNDDYIVVLGGHSPATGHGNHFHQSYIMQFDTIMKPIFARLGISLYTYNMGMGGLGTIQSAMGMKDIYGKNIDLLIWDSYMTESDLGHIEYFFRQGLLSSSTAGSNSNSNTTTNNSNTNTKVPFLLTAGGGEYYEVMQYLHNTYDADIGEIGTGMNGIPIIQNVSHVNGVPYAAQYIQCNDDMKSYCDQERYCTICWIDGNNTKTLLPPRETLFDPPYNNIPTGQNTWHRGWREHLLQSRVLIFLLLEILQDCIQIMSDNTMNGGPLDDSWWHITDYYNNIRNKVLNDEYGGYCANSMNHTNLPTRLCTTSLHSRTYHTPRYQPNISSLSNIIYKDLYDNEDDIPRNTEVMQYNGTPHVHNPCYDIPDNDIDIYTVITNRRNRYRHLNQQQHINSSNSMTTSNVTSVSATITSDSSRIRMEEHQRMITEDKKELLIRPGKGWIVKNEPPGICDGTYDAVCGRARWDACPLIGHHDNRGLLLGNEYSGWIIFQIPYIEHGMILMKIITWMSPTDNWKTNNWTSVNNENNDNETPSTRRQRLLQHKNQSFYSSNNDNNSTIDFDMKRRSNKKKSSIVMDDSYYVDNHDYDDNNEQQLRRHLEVIDYPDEMTFEYMINDGEIHVIWNKEELIQQTKNVQRVVEIITLLDDIHYPKTQNVKIALRLNHCDIRCPFAISHIYWA